jgi:hypothetical protein
MKVSIAIQIWMRHPQGLIVIFHARYLRCSFTRLAAKQTLVAAT